MGIPGLATSLEPYAVRYTSAQLNGYSAIVDGPALAYHAHLLAAETTKAYPPSYSDINYQAIRWLKSLEGIKIKVSAILFDGALPDSKKAERSARLQQMVKRVTQLRSIYNDTTCPVPTKLGSVIYSFLAPSFMEALRSTEFARYSHIVPGEADDWCASYARDTPRSIVFTGDTDLLLYDYPPEALIIFFKDVHNLPESDSRVYSPSTICQRLELKSLVPLAYAITVNRWKSFTDNVQEAKDRHNHLESSDYAYFRRRYIHVCCPPIDINADPELSAAMQALDVRVSEFVVQALSLSEIPLTPDVYLPLLFEDPNEASAWKLGLDLRLLAYSLLMPRSNKVVREFMRRAQDVAVQAHAVLAPSTIETQVLDLANLVTEWSARLQFSSRQRWLLIAVRLAMNVMKAPHALLLSRVVKDDFDNTWAYVHLNARLQAVLYSLRFLKQCISIWLARTPQTDGLYEPVLGLFGPMRTMPPIAELFSLPGANTESPKSDTRLLEALKDVFASVGINDQELFEEPKSKRQKKREKARRNKEQRDKESSTKHSSSNIFALLDQRSTSQN